MGEKRVVHIFFGGGPHSARGPLVTYLTPLARALAAPLMLRPDYVIANMYLLCTFTWCMISRYSVVSVKSSVLFKMGMLDEPNLICYYFYVTGRDIDWKTSNTYLSH